MSVLRVFLTTDSEFAIENLQKPKGNPEINAREKAPYFRGFLHFGLGHQIVGDSIL